MYGIFASFRRGSQLENITLHARDLSSKISPSIARILKDAKRTNNGRKHPKISTLQLARTKRKFIQQGKEWPQEPLPPLNLKPYRKGHKWEEAKAARKVTIAENMAKMPQMIAEYREQVRERREKYRKRKDAAKKDPNQPEYVQYLLAKGVRLADIAVKLGTQNKKAKI
ncbi:hypothetical protein TrispH2_000425 [Trichoplax sp. H2]|nr:hypothetical protein TrispH2_000425 [Trichoplax sp. H2]|eukprot:RDD47369.1 hypothetical protein TrispH2_000425 [Trichoplax sp. H2]